MMPGRTVHDTPQFGDPVEDTPVPAQRGIPSSYWEAVARHAQANPGKWIPLINSPLSESRLESIARGIRGSRELSQVPLGVRIPGFTARIRQRTFWFRYDPPEAL